MLLISVIVVNNQMIKTKLFKFFFTFFTLNLLAFGFTEILITALDCRVNLFIYYLDYPISALFLAIFTYFKIILTYFYKFKNSTQIEEFIYETEITFRGRKLKLNSFLDSGNRLYDDVYDMPIVVISFNEVQKIINKSEALSILLKKNVSTISTMHYITYSTASSNNCKMPVFKIDNLKIKHQNIEKNLSCMLGISFSRISNGFNYQMLIGLDVVKNLK